ncbi:MAG: Pr6Pr family membrane protein [Chitinophagaceae bacterium]
MNGQKTTETIWNFFSYFTILTNLMVALCLSFILFGTGSPSGKFFSKPPVIAAIALYIFIVGLVYNIILRFIWEPRGLQLWVDEALHVVVPILFVSFWLLMVPKGKIKWIHPFKWLIYPAVYLAYSLLRGTFSGFYAYPFIDVKQLGYTHVFLNAAGLMLVFIISGFLLTAIDKFMSRSKIRNRLFS